MLFRSPKQLALDFEPYDDQLNAVIAAQTIGRGIIALPTGVGKSAVIAMLIAVTGLRTLVIVPNLELKKQLSDSLTKAFGVLDDITVENIDSKALIKATDYDVLIIDEAHHSAARTYHKLNKTAWTKISRRFFLTATPFRNQENEQLLFEAISGDVIYRLSYKDAISKGYIVPVEAYYIEVPKQKTDAYTWREVYSELVVHNEVRNDVIASTLLRLNAGNKATLCLVKEIEHGNILSQITGIPFVSGQDDASRDYIRQFNAGEICSLLGTNGVIGEGVDTKLCEYVLIAGLGKAKSAFLQQIGRAVRVYPDKESAKVILFKDRSHKWTIAHFNAQKKILLDEYGIDCVVLE